MISTSCVDFLYYSGYVSMGYYWLRMMNTAAEKLKTASGTEADFYKSKIETGQFYFDRLLPRAVSHGIAAVQSPKSTMQMSEKRFGIQY
jgi:hypothetical protein